MKDAIPETVKKLAEKNDVEFSGHTHSFGTANVTVYKGDYSKFTSLLEDLYKVGIGIRTCEFRTKNQMRFWFGPLEKKTKEVEKTVVEEKQFFEVSK